MSEKNGQLDAIPFIVFVLGIGLLEISHGSGLKPVLQGWDVELRCEIDQSSGNELVKWESSRHGLVAEGSLIFLGNPVTRYSINQPRDGEYNLLIKNVLETDEANFSCWQGNKILQEWKLLIEAKPHFLGEQSSPHAVEAEEGSDVTLWCNVNGKPLPKVTWSRQRSDNKTAPLIDLGITGNWLLFRNVSRYAADMYICNASNKYETVLWDIQLFVKFAPDVYVMEPEVYHEDGSDLTVTCMAQGYPIDEVYLEGIFGRAPPSSWRYNITNTTDDYYHMTTFNFKFNNGWKVYGNYTCNARGLKTVAASLRVLYPTEMSFPTTEESVTRYDPGTE